MLSGLNKTRAKEELQTLFERYEQMINGREEITPALIIKT